MQIYNFFYIKTFKIAPTCFDPKIIFRELYCSLLKSHLKKKHSLINFLILIVVLCKSYATDSAPGYVCRVLRS